MRPSIEISIDLTAQEQLAPYTPSNMVEVEDICDVDPLLCTVANADSAAERIPSSSDCDDSIEIELTAEQMDALLNQEG